MEELKKEWEIQFDEKFTYVGNVSAFKNGKRISLTGRGNERFTVGRIKSFISYLLAKQQDDFVKILEDKQKIFNFIPRDKNGYKMVKESDLNLIAYIKSKLK